MQDYRGLEQVGGGRLCGFVVAKMSEVGGIMAWPELCLMALNRDETGIIAALLFPLRGASEGLPEFWGADGGAGA